MPTDSTFCSASTAPIQITTTRSMPNTSWLALLKPRPMRASRTSWLTVSTIRFSYAARRRGSSPATFRLCMPRSDSSRWVCCLAAATSWRSVPSRTGR